MRRSLCINNQEFNEIYKESVIYNGIEESQNPIFFDWENRNENQPKRCRFCLKDENEVSFGTDLTAHAISKTIGNNKLFSKYECKTCNSLFGRKYEDDFAKFVFPFKMISKIFGRKDFMKYINPKTGHSIIINKEPFLNNEKYKTNGLIIDNSQFERHICINEETGKVSIHFERQGYNPPDVYKAIVKMALSVMKQKDFEEDLKDWVTMVAGLLSPQEKGFNINRCALEFVSGLNPFKGTNIALYKRKSNESKLPKYHFNISFGNFCIHAPICLISESNKNTIIKFESHFKDANMTCINFEEKEPVYTCNMKADIKILNDDERKELENTLRSEKYI